MVPFMDYTKALHDYIASERTMLDQLPLAAVNDVMNVLEQARLSGRRIYTCGNGGSAATASHMVCDFNKGVSAEQEQKYDFTCLSDNAATMMAVGNDISYDDIFVFPLRGKLQTGDVVIGISGSGNSENVVRALQYANEQGAETIAFTGYSGGRMKAIAKHNIHVAIDNMQIAEDLHLVLNHMMMYVLGSSGGQA